MAAPDKQKQMQMCCSQKTEKSSAWGRSAHAEEFFWLNLFHQTTQKHTSEQAVLTIPAPARTQTRPGCSPWFSSTRSRPLDDPCLRVLRLRWSRGGRVSGRGKACQHRAAAPLSNNPILMSRLPHHHNHKAHSWIIRKSWGSRLRCVRRAAQTVWGRCPTVFVWRAKVSALI